MPQHSSLVTRHSSLQTWLALIATLLVCLPPLLINLNAHLSTHTMENVALVTSQETWLRWHEGEAGAWLVTSNDGLPRVEKPPLLTWLNFLVWSDLDPRTATPVQLTQRARLVAVVMGLIMLGAIFWIGNTLGGVRTAVLAMLAAGSMFFFQRQARAASYDIHFTAWATLAVAAALWALKPRGEPPPRSRMLWGWSMAGLAMACSVLSKNPLSMLIVLMPVAGAIALLPGRRRGGIVGALGAVALTVLIVAPWYVYVIQTIPGARQTLLNESRQPRMDPQVFYYYLGLFGLVAPWTIWLICGLVQPWAKRDWPQRRQLLIAWLWFMLIFVFFSIPPAQQQRYILPIVPAAALLCAQVFSEYHARSMKGDRDRLGIALASLMSVVMMLPPIALGVVLGAPHWLARHIPAWFGERLFIDVGVPFAVTLAGALLIVSMLGLRWSVTWKPQRFAWALAAWALIITTAFWHIDSGQSKRADEVRAFKSEAERLAKIVTGSGGVRSLRITNRDHEKYKLNEEFRFYFGKLIRRITPSELNDFASQASTPVFVLTKPGEEYSGALRKAGYQLVDEHVMTDEDDVQQLWRK